MQFMTREMFDLRIIIVIVGLIAAAFRLRADLFRPLPPERGEWQTFDPDEDTKPNEAHE